MSLYGLDTGFKNGKKKLSVTTTAVTGTAAVVTGLLGIDAGGAVACPQNAATTIPSTAVAAVTSIAAGTVNLVAVALAAAANTVSAVATNVAVWAIGQ